MQRRLEAIVDVLRVPVHGDAGVAVIGVPSGDATATIDCEVLVVGGGTGGVAAALAAARRGCNTCLLEETDWLGGQLTAQGISALDEHAHIETFGGTASYYALRNALRAHYRALAQPPATMPDFNPGDCWVTRLAFEPAVAERLLREMLAPYIAAGRLRLYMRHKTVSVDAHAGTLHGLTALDLERRSLLRFKAQRYIDATELGDLLPLAGVAYRVGAETIAQTGEAHAQPTDAKPHCVQSFTYPFAAERRPDGERHVIDAPEGYAHWRDTQPYSLTIEVHGGEIYGEDSGWLAYRLYDRLPGTKGGLWTYRRLIAAAQFGGRTAHDVTMFNWPGNDYRDRGIIDVPAADMALALRDAKRVSLGFLHWLQTEAPATGDRLGAPELALRPDVMGSADGLSKFPYVRESRRLVAQVAIREQQVSAHFQHGEYAEHFDDAVGVGWYPIDIHRAGPDDVGVSCRTRPFQIPLGALLPRDGGNLIAGAKNIGTTHITNGCYRLHPVEWNIGEAAGALAAFSLQHRMAPDAVRTQALHAFQRSLLDEGVPLAWTFDVGVSDPNFATVQALAMRMPRT